MTELSETDNTWFFHVLGYVVRRYQYDSYFERELASF